MVAPRSQSDLMADPGAYASTQIPQFEYDAFASVFSEAATVNTPLAPAGDEVHASALSFPPAPARNTPQVQRVVTAVVSAAQPPPPRDMLATARLWRVAGTPTPPAITSEVKPSPAQPNPRTPCSETPSATP